MLHNSIAVRLWQVLQGPEQTITSLVGTHAAFGQSKTIEHLVKRMIGKLKLVVMNGRREHVTLAMLF